MKHFSRLLIVLALIITGFAGMSTVAEAGYTVAQNYAYYPTISQPAVGGCLLLAQDLSYGMRSSAVTSLQQFLIQRGYLNATATGYFGPATQSAVRSFQSSIGIAPTGIVDIATRAVLYSQSCGNGANTGYNYPTYPTNPSYPTYPNYPTYPTTPVYPTYPNNYQNYNQNQPVYISSLSAYSGQVGNTITIYGTGFDYYNNTVNFGGVTVTAQSSNGSSVSFIVPQTYQTSSYSNNYNQNCSQVYPYNCNNTSGASSQVQVTVVTSHGTSNPVTFTLNNTNYYNNNYNGNQTCSQVYPYTCYNYNNYNQYGNGQMSISYFSPNQGRVGTQVMVYGSGLSGYNTIVHFGSATIQAVSSSDTYLYFTIPYYLNYCDTLTNSYCPTNPTSVTPGTYPVYVSNSQGQSGVLYFTVIQ